MLPDHPPALEKFKGVNYRRLEAILNQDPKKLIQLLMECKLIPSARNCPDCGKPMKLVTRKDSNIGYQFECPDRKGCRARLSATSDSFFGRAHLHVLRFIYFFAMNEYKYSKIQHELRRDDDKNGKKGSTFSTKTICDWISFLREVCASAIDMDPQQIGGEGKVVEIDETCMVKHKFHRGTRKAQPTWVFGGVERGDRSKMFCVVVAKRDKATLEPLIQRFIAPKPTIISDGWAAYCSIEDLDGDYIHQVVNHSKQFKDPDTGAHTNGIEGEWMHLKKPQKAANGRARTQLEPTLFEHMFRRRFKDDDVFYALLVYITKVYDVVEKSKEDIVGTDDTEQVGEESDQGQRGDEEDENQVEEGIDGNVTHKRKSDATETTPTTKKVRETSPNLFDYFRELFSDTD